MKTEYIKKNEAKQVHSRYISGMILLLTILGVLICANITFASIWEENYAGTYTAKRNTEDGTQTMTFELNKNSKATLRVVSSKFSILPKVYTGDWNATNSGRIEIYIKRGSFVFMYETGRLRPISWNREEWGSDLPTFQPKFLNNYREKYSSKYLGTYYANIRKSGLDQTLILTIKRDGNASLSQESINRYNVNKKHTEDEDYRNDEGNRKADKYRNIYTYAAKWFEESNNVIRVEITKGRFNSSSFTLRKIGNRLETVNWDRDEWGYSPVKFMADNNYDRPGWDDGDNRDKPGSYNKGTFVAYNDNGFKRRRLSLDLQFDNIAVLTITEGINERIYRGTWDERSFGAIKVVVRRGDKDVRFDLRPYKRGYQTTYWNKEDWGNEPIVFTKR